MCVCVCVHDYILPGQMYASCIYGFIHRSSAGVRLTSAFPKLSRSIYTYARTHRKFREYRGLRAPCMTRTVQRGRVRGEKLN